MISKLLYYRSDAVSLSVMALSFVILVLYIVIFPSIMESIQVKVHHPCSVTVKIPFVSYEPKYPPPLGSNPCCAFIDNEIADYQVAKFMGLSNQELNKKNKTLNAYIQRLREPIPELKGVGLISTFPDISNKQMMIKYHLIFPTFNDPCTSIKLPKTMWQNLRNLTFNEMNAVLSTKTIDKPITGISSSEEISTITSTEQINTERSGFSKANIFIESINVENFDYPQYPYHDDKSSGPQNKASIHVLVNVFILIALAFFI